MSPRNAERDLQMRERRIDQILDAAREVMAVKGIGSAGINDIAAEAKISIGNIYHYFSSKEEIFSALLKRGQVGYGKLVAELAEESGSAVEKLLKLSTAWLAADNVWTQTILLVSSRMSELTSPEEREAITGRFAANLTPLAAIFEQGIREGTLRDGDPLEHAMYFVSFMQGLVLQQVPGIRVPVALRAERVVSYFRSEKTE